MLLAHSLILLSDTCSLTCLNVRYANSPYCRIVCEGNLGATHCKHERCQSHLVDRTLVESLGSSRGLWHSSSPVGQHGARHQTVELFDPGAASGAHLVLIFSLSTTFSLLISRSESLSISPLSLALSLPLLSSTSLPLSLSLLLCGLVISRCLAFSLSCLNVSLLSPGTTQAHRRHSSQH